MASVRRGSAKRCRGRHESDRADDGHPLANGKEDDVVEAGAESDGRDEHEYHPTEAGAVSQRLPEGDDHDRREYHLHQHEQPGAADHVRGRQGGTDVEYPPRERSALGEAGDRAVDRECGRDAVERVPEQHHQSGTAGDRGRRGEQDTDQDPPDAGDQGGSDEGDRRPERAYLDELASGDDVH